MTLSFPRPCLRRCSWIVGLCVSLLSTGAWAQQEIPIFVAGKDRPYELLSPGQPKLITVRGPGELRLVSRARFKPADKDGIRYALRVAVDGGMEQEVVYEDVARSRTAMFRDGTLGMPGRLMEYRIQLRRGYHNVSVVPSQESPQVFFRHLFKPTKERRRAWVSVTPLQDPKLVELVSREKIVPYYRNEPGKAFDLEIIGPTELRVFTRLENTPEMRGRIQYRLQVRENDRVINTFQLSSRRSDITVYGDSQYDELVPGRAVEIVIPVPKGRHRFQILPMDQDKSTLLARFMLPRSDLALTAEP